jgi:tetratricopeptide (TPR) repeat protein
VLLAQGDLEAAISLLRESYAAADEWGAPRQRASAARTLARALLMRGDVDEAAALTRESLVLTQEIGEANGTAECLETAGGIAALRGSPSEAAQLFGAAEALRESIGARRHLDIEAWNRGAVDDVRARLGDAFESEYERGRKLPPDDVLRLAGAAI